MNISTNDTNHESRPNDGSVKWRIYASLGLNELNNI